MIEQLIGGMIGKYMVETVYDTVVDQMSLIWRDPQGDTFSGKRVTIDGKTYDAPEVSDLVRHGAVRLATHANYGFPDTRGAFELVDEYLESVFLFGDPTTRRMLAWWVLYTWVYDAFDVCPSVEITCAAGCGKSELMRRMGLVCYRPIAAMGAGSVTTLANALDMCRGTVLIDEADLQDERMDSIAELYNLGATKGSPMWRVNNGVQKAYYTYGPKIVVRRRPGTMPQLNLRVALQPVAMDELTAHNIGLTLDTHRAMFASAVRNCLMGWRMLVMPVRNLGVMDFAQGDMPSTQLEYLMRSVAATGGEELDRDARDTVRAFLSKGEQ